MLSIVLFAFLFIIERKYETGIVPVPELAWTAFILFVVAAITDLVDGAVARRTGMSDFGRVADPFVDKVLITGTLIFVVAIIPTRELVPTWSVVVVVAREFLITGIRGFVESRGVRLPADVFGKSKMVLQCMAIGGAILYLTQTGSPPAGEGVVHTFFEWVPMLTRIVWWVAFAVTVFSGASYVIRSLRMLAARSVAGA